MGASDYVDCRCPLTGYQRPSMRAQQSNRMEGIPSQRKKGYKERRGRTFFIPGKSVEHVSGSCNQAKQENMHICFYIPYPMI
jgi:hypothetical protein